MKKTYLFLALALSSCFFISSLSAQVTLYGTTSGGGAHDSGTIFSYNVTTATFTDLIDFGTAAPGYQPRCSLLMAIDGNMYGMTLFGGPNGNGNIFKYNPNSPAYTNLVDFTGNSGLFPGKSPYGSLIQATDSNLYGLTAEGGNGFPDGNLFKYNPTTTIFTNLVTFTGAFMGPDTGFQPKGNLIQTSDSILYGLTGLGGNSANGNIFKYNIVTHIYTNLIDMTGTSGSAPGDGPEGTLIMAKDSNLYGMTALGSVHDKGSIFKYNPKTNAFTSLVSFTGTSGAYIGYAPQGSLVQATDGNLYGMTELGGTLGHGNIFKFNPTTNTYTDLVDFTGTSGSYLGQSPWGDLMQASDSNLYGMTASGGVSGYGNIFQYNPKTNSFTNLVDFTGISGLHPGQGPTAALIQYNNQTTGVSPLSTSHSAISIYPNPASGMVNVQLSGFTGKATFTLYDISGKELWNQTGENKTLYSFNVSAYPAGVYILKVQEGNDVQIMRKVTVVR